LCFPTLGNLTNFDWAEVWLWRHPYGTFHRPNIPRVSQYRFYDARAIGFVTSRLTPFVGNIFRMLRNGGHAMRLGGRVFPSYSKASPCIIT